MILRGGKFKPFHIDQIDQYTWRRIERCPDMRCGINMPFFTKHLFRVPDLIFLNSCKKHDLMTRRGGGLLDWFETNYYFWRYNYADVFLFVWYLVKKVSDYPIINKLIVLLAISVLALILFIVATVYSIVATIGTIFVFSWGKYNSLEDILRDAGC